MLVRCFGCGGGLEDVHAVTGIPKTRLLKWPPPEELGEPISESRRGTAHVDPPPSEGSVAGWHSTLLSSPDALRYLLEERRLSIGTILDYELGYDRPKDAIAFPVRDNAGELVNLKRRFLDPAADPKTRALSRPANWYPDVPASGALLLVAGEIDALTGRQLGLPTVTTTCGATVPEHLLGALAHRDVYVMFDVGEDVAAKRTARRLQTVQARPLIVRLSRLGLPDRADLNDFYRQGGTKRDLERLIKRERRSA